MTSGTGNSLNMPTFRQRVDYFAGRIKSQGLFPAGAAARFAGEGAHYEPDHRPFSWHFP